MESARIRRRLERSKILRIQNYLASHPLGTENITVFHYKARLHLLIESFASFKQVHNKLTADIQTDNAEQKQSNQQYYLHVKEKFHVLEKELLHNISILNYPASINENSISVLQPSAIANSLENTIPTFSGNVRDWPAFCDVFTSTIHFNHNLSDALKFMCFKSALQGEALSTLQHFAITNYNYTVAWNKLKHRYGQHHHGIQSQVKMCRNETVVTRCDASDSIQPVTSYKCFVPLIENHHSSTTTTSNSNRNHSTSQFITVHNQFSNSFNIW